MPTWENAEKSLAENDGSDWSDAEEGKDVLLAVIDVSMASDWLTNCLDLLVKMLKQKLIAQDNSRCGVILYGTSEKKNVNGLENVFELQELGFPSAQRIKQLQQFQLSEVSTNDKTVDKSLSNALWHASIAFSSLNLKKKDLQRIWLFTDDDLPSPQEQERIIKQTTQHTELDRVLNLFCIPSKDTTSNFQLHRFFSKLFTDATELESNENLLTSSNTQPAYQIHTLPELIETSLRKTFRKRRLNTLKLRFTTDICIGVEVYGLRIIQRKNFPVYLDAEDNVQLKIETKWLCDDTGVYLSNEQIKRYLHYGGKRVYFSTDDVIEIKHFESSGIQILHFQPESDLPMNGNLRPPYFLFPSESYIEGSTCAFAAIHAGMIKKSVMAIARLTMRTNQEPRLVALLAQEEKSDEFGQMQPAGFLVVFLPYLDDIRSLKFEKQPTGIDEQVEAAGELISSLSLSELPAFENPELQKHYASIQALALDEDELEFNEEDDTTLPDQDGFEAESVKDKISKFLEVCGGDELDRSELKRKSVTAKSSVKSTKKVKKANDEVKLEKADWQKLIESGAISKKTVAQLKSALTEFGLPVKGRKADLIEALEEFLQEQ